MAENMKLFLELGAKTRGFTRGMANSKGAVSKFARGAKRELASLRGMFTSIRGQAASLGLTIGAAKIMLDSARLDKSLTQIGQTAGAGAVQVAQLRKDLFGMARESGQQVENLRDGFNDLVQSGLDMRQAKETLEGINIAMAVTGSNAQTLAGGITVGARQFKFDLSQPGKALEMLDKMTVAGRLGNAELEDLSSVFARIGNNASRAKFGFDKTLAFVEGLSLAEKNPERLATLADSTMRVFTNMRYMRAAQKGTGVSFFNPDKSRRDAFAVLADIKKKYDTLTTDMAREGFINNAFGKADQDTIKGISMLLDGDSLIQLGHFSEKIANAGGTLRRDFDEATANLIDQAGMLKNDLREAADGFVHPIDVTLGKFIQFVRDKKENGGWGLDGKDMILGGAAALGGTALAARYGGKALSGIAGKFLKGAGSLGAGVAKGKAIEAATGVKPVFVVNWPNNFDMGSGNIAKGLKSAVGGKNSFLNHLLDSGGSKKLLIGAPASTSLRGKLLASLGGLGKTLAGSLGSTSLLTTAGGVGLAGGGGYALGTILERLSGGWLADKMTGGKYGGSGWMGDWLYDVVHGKESQPINIHNEIAVDRNDRSVSKTNDMNTQISTTVKRGDFIGM
ncbi:MAG: phage tail tape measure protein [Gammaproteobacteria bacterium]|nr:phage tail tape measure protein [Gammaproteobacteria bacterium]